MQTVLDKLLAGGLLKCNTQLEYAEAMSTFNHIKQYYATYKGKRCVGVSVCGNLPWTVKVHYQ